MEESSSVKVENDNEDIPKQTNGSFKLENEIQKDELNACSNEKEEIPLNESQNSQNENHGKNLNKNFRLHFCMF